MAATPRISGFNANEVRAGLRLAMEVGLPPDIADQPVFVFPGEIVDDGLERDAEGTPLDWRATKQRGPDETVQVPCAIEYMDGYGDGNIENFGVVMPSRVALTFLDEDYVEIRGFSYVMIGGNRYNYQRTEPPIGLVSVGVWRVHVRSDDEG
jgi:hypothetical protein